MEGRIFFRIVREQVPSALDFRSHKQLARPLRDPRREREWADGISVYDSLGYAVAQARALKLRAGRFVVPLLVANDGSIDVRQTGADPRHYTIFVTGESALALVCGPAVPVEDAP